MKQHAAILGSGIHLPGTVVRNDVLESMLGLEEGFIEKTTGIRERRWPEDRETVEYMAAEAAASAVVNAEIESIEAVVVARDLIATRRAHSIGLPVLEKIGTYGINTQGAFSIDLTNYCSGFVHGVNIARALVESHQAKNVVVVASTKYDDVVSDKLARSEGDAEKLDPNSDEIFRYSLGQRGIFQPSKLNAFLWGSGAGAVVVGASDKKRIHDFDARGSSNYRREVFGFGDAFHDRKSFASLDGRAIYKYALTEVVDFVNNFAEESGYDLGEIDHFIFHQPQPRMLRRLQEKLGLPDEKVHVTCDTLGNMIGASVPVTYQLAKDAGMIKQNNRVMFCSFGDSYLQSAGLVFEEGR